MKLSKISKAVMRIVTTGLVLGCVPGFVNAIGTRSATGPPYPPSTLITGISFDWTTHDRRAPGSDNWPITWADDDHQYTAWGDGGGFGGTNGDGRVSLGVARIEGGKDSYTGSNVWGGKNPENLGRFGGKSYGIISADGVLYMWRSGAASGATAYDFQRLYRSTNYGATWTPAKWAFSRSDGIFVPTFLQFGKDYQGAIDQYVYIYAPHIKRSNWDIHKPGEIALGRVPKTKLMDRSAYEFFAGFDSSRNPMWSPNIVDRKPVFEDLGNGVRCTSVSYNPGLRRYLLITEHTARNGGNIGIYEAPEPWGPWRTVLFQSQFGDPAIQATTFFWNFSNKWLSPDGKNFVLVFAGARGSNDSWNTVKGTFSLRMRTRELGEQH